WRAGFSNLDAWMPIARDLYRRRLKWQCRWLWVRVDVGTAIEWKRDHETKTEKIDAQGWRKAAPGRSRRHGDRAQRRDSGDRGNENQPHAHRLQHHHLRGA